LAELLGAIKVPGPHNATCHTRTSALCLPKHTHRERDRPTHKLDPTHRDTQTHTERDTVSRTALLGGCGGGRLACRRCRCLLRFQGLLRHGGVAGPQADTHRHRHRHAQTGTESNGHGSPRVRCMIGCHRNARRGSSWTPPPCACRAPHLDPHAQAHAHTRTHTRTCTCTHTHTHRHTQ
jgi:hypothetical protein